jgi:signal transduction histidine kinase/ActR/RegA family two-component response regulator
MTFRLKMILSGTAAIIIPFLIAGVVTYIKLSNSLEELAKGKTIQIAGFLSNLLQVSLAREVNLVVAVSKDPEVIEAASLSNFRILDKKLVNIYHFSGAAIGSLFITDKYGIDVSDGIYKNAIGLNLSDREYFTKAKAGKTYISNPIIPRVSDLRMINVISSPIFSKNGTFNGMVGMGLNIEYLLEQISSVKLGKTGYTFIIDTTGTFIAHPIKEYILKMNIQDQPGMERIAEKMLRNQTGAESYVFNSIEKIAGFTPVELTGWSVAVTQNKDEIMAPAKAILSFIVIGGCIFFLITVGSIVLFSKRISNPIQKLVETLKQLTIHSAEIVIYIGRNKKIEFVNPAMEKLMRCAANDIVGTKPVLTNSNNIPEKDIWHTLDEGNLWTGRIKFMPDNSEPFTLEVLIIPIRDNRGIIDTYMEIGRNITQELMVETRLEQAQKLEAIGTLAGGIAHDFNNILSGIFGYTELSLSDLNDPALVKEYLQHVLFSAERARDLVNQILTFSRQTEVELKAITPGYTINEALKLLRASIPTTIELRTMIESDSAILGDQTQFHELIVNLCTNAAYAMKSKKGVIEINLEDFDVDEEFAKRHPGLEPGKHILLRVSDTGCGIKSDLLDRIFEPFFTTKSQGESSGLGLSIVHGIIKKFKGTISVYSELDKGTTFNIIIPAIIPETIDIDTEQNVDLPGGTERILLIDDEKTILNAIHIILIKLGYKVFTFNDTILALEAFKNDPQCYDLIITDYTMPHLTGIDIAGKIKEIREDIPIILCSGYMHKGLEVEAFKVGISELLRKPLTTLELASAIRRVLQKN